MATAQTIHDNLGIPEKSEADTIKALKLAAGEAWPSFKINEYVTSAGTFASTTFEYSLSAITTITEQGVAEVYVAASASTTEPVIRLRGWQQRADNASGTTTWTLIFPSGITSAYNARAFHVAFQRAPTQPTVITSTLDDAVPYEYWIAYATWWYAALGLFKQQTDLSPYRDAVVLWRDRIDKIKKYKATPPLTAGHFNWKDRPR